MCGINAVFRKDSTRVDRDDLGRMNSAISHRGPDGAGFALLNHGAVGLGHVRLSIIDLHDGAQPLYNEDGTIAVTFNGEIYDYQNLRLDLMRRGHKFRTKTDTEVLVHLYEEYGDDFVSHLNGEFAFILWDQNRKRLLAARDRFGVKPLFYYVSDKEVLFSSEVKGLFSLPRIPREMNPDYFAGPFFSAFPLAISAFRNIESVKPGHLLILNSSGDLSERSYWQPEFKVDRTMTPAEAQEGVAVRLQKSVERRMVADVPVGAYLSGGLDSTLVCSFMAEHSNTPRAFSIGFGKTIYDESSVAAETAKFYGAQFSTIDCSDEIMAEAVTKTIFHCEQPLANPNSMAKVRLSDLVRRSGYKVCLTGEGADEVFGGYPFFKLEMLWSLMAEEGEPRRIGKRLYKEFLKREARSEGLLWNRTRKWRRMKQYFGYPSFHEARMMSSSFFYPRIISEEMREQSSYFDPMDFFVRQYSIDKMKAVHPFNRTRQIAMNQLRSYIIPSLGDRVEMANSVECRTPFLDKDLVEFALMIPPEQFIDIQRLAEKDVLRKACQKRLPPQVARTGKHPFMAPSWYSVTRTRLGREILEDSMSDRRIRDVGLFGPAFIKRLKFYWKVLPKSTSYWKRFDVLAGLILSTQVLHRLMIENPIVTSDRFPMVDRSFTPPQRPPADITV